MKKKPDWVEVSNPFIGFRSFDASDAADFFGREALIQSLVRKLADARLLAVIGAAGCGKSSLVKAGLLPALRVGDQPGFPHAAWQAVCFTPGTDPFGNLAQALHATWIAQHPTIGVTELETLLRTQPESLLRGSNATNLLLVVDQFDELFRHPSAGEIPDEQTVSFTKWLLGLSRQPDSAVYVVLTMRSDFLDTCSDVEGLTEALNHGCYLVPPLSQAEMSRAITEPVRKRGGAVTDALRERLLADFGERADQLPALQHALMRTWQVAHAAPTLDVSDYEDAGGRDQVILNHAEAIYATLGGAEKSRVEKLFRGLVLLNPDFNSRFQPVTVQALSAITGVELESLLDVLDRFRDPAVAFLTPGVRGDQRSVVAVTHEHLLTQWSRLRDWIAEETESAKRYCQASLAAQRYQQGNGALWVNPELQLGVAWMEKTRPTQAWANRYDPYLERVLNFLKHSQNQYTAAVRKAEDRRTRELRRARTVSVLMAAGTLVSLLFLISSAVLRTQAQQSEEEALAEKKIALFERSRAERQTREATTQQKIAEQQEAISEQQRLLTEAQRLVAVREQRTAEEKRREAEVARRMAETQKQRAEVARAEAVQQRQQADRSRTEAERQRTFADESRKEAESQRGRAVVAQRFAEQQRGTAIARSLAIQSYQMPRSPNDDLPALLALEAFTLQGKNGGQSDNPDVFNALAKAADAGTVLRHHTDLVRAVTVQPQGETQWLASASDDGTVKLWKAGTARAEPKTFATPRRKADPVRALALGPGGKTLVGAGESGRLYVWNTDRPEAPPVVTNGHGRPVNALLFRPDYGLLVSVSGDGQIRTWKPTAQGLDSLQNVRLAAPLFCARLTPDAQRLFGGSANGKVFDFDVNDLRKSPRLLTRREFGDRVTALAFRSDGQWLATGTSAGMVYAWAMQRGEPEATGTPLPGRHTSTVNDLAFSPDGTLLASASADWSVHLWNAGRLAQPQQPIVLGDFDAWVMTLRFTGDGKRLVAGGADKTVRVLTVDPEELRATLAAKVGRNLTADEWNKFVGKDIPYEKK